MGYKDYRDLKVWQAALELVVFCYKISESFPKHELFGLTNQMQRAAVSIPANIAEGQGKGYQKEFLKHLAIANGSLTELETHIQIAFRLRYINEKDLNKLLNQSGEIGRMISGLKKSIETKQ